MSTADPIETLAILAHCDASVFSFGSYGWFAAWLARGPVVYSAHLTKPTIRGCDVVARSGVGVKDHIPQSWIPL